MQVDREIHGTTGQHRRHDAFELLPRPLLLDLEDCVPRSPDHVARPPSGHPFEGRVPRDDATVTVHQRDPVRRGADDVPELAALVREVCDQFDVLHGDRSFVGEGREELDVCLVPGLEAVTVVHGDRPDRLVLEDHRRRERIPVVRVLVDLAPQDRSAGVQSFVEESREVLSWLIDRSLFSRRDVANPLTHDQDGIPPFPTEQAGELVEEAVQRIG